MGLSHSENKYKRADLLCAKGAVNPGEMLLVLGRPGSGCSTFLKVIGNQRYGYESIEGDVLYGGTDAITMAKKYRSEGRQDTIVTSIRGVQSVC